MGRIVIAGGAGFLGSHLADACLARGDEVVAIDNLITGHLENIEHLNDNAAFSFVEADVIQPFEVDGDVTAVMNLASPASPKDYLEKPIETLLVGSEGTRNCLELAKDKGAKFFQASTSEVYGDPLEHPQTEGYWGHVNPIGPRSVYDEAKRYGEAITMAYHTHYGVDIRIVRIFNTYGPRMRPNDGRVVSNFLVQALTGAPITIYGDGKQTRSFCFVEDEIRGFLALLDSDQIGPINVGNDGEFTMHELADLVIEVTGSSSEIVYEPLPADDPAQRRPDLTKARSLLGWEPKIHLREGLERTAAHFASVLNTAS